MDGVRQTEQIIWICTFFLVIRYNYVVEKTIEEFRVEHSFTKCANNDQVKVRISSVNVIKLTREIYEITSILRVIKRIEVSIAKTGSTYYRLFILNNSLTHVAPVREQQPRYDKLELSSELQTDFLLSQPFVTFF